MSATSELETRRLGAEGPEISVLGLGTNNFGWRIGLEESRAVLDAALGEGVTLLDTADVYGGGESERILGELLQGRRDRVVLLTKFGNNLLPGAPDGRRGSPAYARWALDRSLERLRTDHVDIWMVHRPDPEVPYAETVGAVAEAIKAGKARYAAVSNVSAEQLEEAVAVARAEGVPLVAVENRYSLISRAAEADVIPAAERLGVGLLPYYPLEGGILTGRYRRGEAPPPGSRFAEKADIWPAERWLTDDVFDRVEAVAAVAERAGASLLELAVGGLAALAGVACVIAGATRPEQVRANAAAARWRPDDETLAALRSLPNGR
jgi:aryl-alcohol dehydrogenase-like predicted oxidoreductase